MKKKKKKDKKTKYKYEFKKIKKPFTVANLHY